MKKTRIKTFLIAIIFAMSFSLNSFSADENYNFHDKPLTQSEINLWKYKMERISIKNNLGKWEIVQGINTKLGDMELLRLVGAEKIALERIKNVELKQNLGNGVSLLGLIGAVLSGIILGNIIKVNNGVYYGAGGLGVSAVLLVVGNSISPVISDENSHVITLDEAIDASDSYNKKLREVLKLPDSIQ